MAGFAYDRWLVDEPEQETSMYCCTCGEPIYVGDEYYCVEGENFCSDCIDGCREHARSNKEGREIFMEDVKDELY